MLHAVKFSDGVITLLCFDRKAQPLPVEFTGALGTLDDRGHSGDEANLHFTPPFAYSMRLRGTVDSMMSVAPKRQTSPIHTDRLPGAFWPPPYACMDKLSPEVHRPLDTFTELRQR